MVEFTDPIKFHEFHDSDKVDIFLRKTAWRSTTSCKRRMSQCPQTWARLKLYGALQLLGERCLYFNTDSVIFLSSPDDQEPPLGKYLGDFKDELDGNDYSVEFVSGGPKNYGYRTKNGKTCCKVRGFSLNSEAEGYLNYDVMRQNVIDEVNNPQSSSSNCRPQNLPYRTGCQELQTVHVPAFQTVPARVLEKDSGFIYFQDISLRVRLF